MSGALLRELTRTESLTFFTLLSVLASRYAKNSPRVRKKLTLPEFELLLQSDRVCVIRLSLFWSTAHAEFAR